VMNETKFMTTQPLFVTTRRFARETSRNSRQPAGSP